MLETVKTALNLTTDTFDYEIMNWIGAAVKDMNIAGVDGETVVVDSIDPIIIAAICTYCGYRFELNHGSLERMAAYKESYDEQKAQLSMATGYTVFTTEE